MQLRSATTAEVKRSCQQQALQDAMETGESWPCRICFLMLLNCMFLLSFLFVFEDHFKLKEFVTFNRFLLVF